MRGTKIAVFVEGSMSICLNLMINDSSGVIVTTKLSCSIIKRGLWIDIATAIFENNSQNRW